MGEKLAPLFGTSGHFRTHILFEQNGWDYYNVTEDWELCIRLQQNSYHIALLDSVTHNAVVTSYGTFLRQRTRWIKGFLQTFFWQTQNPATLVRSLGWWRSMAFMLKSGLNVFNLMIGLATRIVPLLWLGFYYFRGTRDPFIPYCNRVWAQFGLPMLEYRRPVDSGYHNAPLAPGAIRASDAFLLGAVEHRRLAWHVAIAGCSFQLGQDTACGGLTSVRDHVS